MNDNNSESRVTFKNASQAAILRASQKDEEFIEKLKINIVEVIRRIFGIRGWMKVHKWLDEFCEFLYFAITTISARQTLGEEYAGLLQINDRLKLPSILERTTMVLLQCFGVKIIQNLLNKLDKSTKNGYLSSYLRPQLSASIQTLLPTLKSVPTFLLKIHLASFYFNSSYYHLSKRTTGARYVLVRDWYGDGSGRKMFRILGVVLYSHIILYSIFSAITYYRDKKLSEDRSTSQDAYVSPSLQCSLCLGERKYPCATPCGHVFCWNCLHTSLLSIKECPLCRFAVEPERVIPLLNYH